jgi:hypothetical protein
MNRKKVDSHLERTFLTALITCKPFLAAAAPVMDLGLLQTDYFRQVAEWCKEYWVKYNDAPGRNIEAIYYAWSEKQPLLTPLAESIHALLGHLSDQYDTAGQELNVPHLIDELSGYLTLRSLDRLQNDVHIAIDQGDTAEAKRIVSDYRGITLGQGIGFDALNDRAPWERAFAEQTPSLIRFPGDAGRFLNDAFTAESLIGVQGPEKRGKTSWCMEFAMRALRDRKKVAFFEVGDLSERQIILRLGIRLTGLPLWPKQVGAIAVPTSIEMKTAEQIESDKAEFGKGHPRASVIYTDEDCPSTVNYRDARRACRRFLRGRGIPSNTPFFKISVHANSSINVAGINDILKQWQYEEGFIPQVIIIDYPDILAPENTKDEFRHSVNSTWKAMRKLSQEWHAAVVAPTQADAASYDKETIGAGNFSEDKRKNAHVTGMLGLNQTPKEKEMGIMRLNWILLRESDFRADRCLHVAQCIPLGRAFCAGVL